MTFSSDHVLLGPLLVILTVLLDLATMARILLRRHRDPAARIAWLMVIGTLHILGVIAYLLVGEVRLGRSRSIRRQRAFRVWEETADPGPAQTPDFAASAPERYRYLFQLGHAISGFAPVSGNAAHLLPDSNATIDALVADIDAARDHVHLLFYIWLTDHNGLKVVEALKRAAARGVSCRAMADDLGSRALIRSPQWQAMRDAGVHVAPGLPIGNPLLRAFKGRIDVRNHRKIVVIDNRITYCGSQNCADPEFRVKPRFAPWVDAVMRFEGPIAHQNQVLFVIDWMTSVEEDLTPLLHLPPAPPCGDMTAQVIGTGPTQIYSAMPELFESLLFAARREVVITTPYYVPNEPLQNALCTTARRGVKTTIIFPARNDSWVVAATSRSYYFDLLDAGVRIFEYHGGLLHTKSMTVDGGVTLIGSANMDRRSFDLNFENNILFHDETLTAVMRQRQAAYIARSVEVSIRDVEAWPIWRRLWNNSVAMVGPVL
ncbi:cardiolipin synthase [Rhodopila sp.]|jgi:cardiolipin synthase|uniref:cardiolipin synthase n=1 Tax=Rhodopila sp. TaxID=2480087 RepID=UPI002BFFF3B9|nr:cardiolipin synthase [Rhodopila sp.]HVZ06431.1 cardiolipin synthase [Rhodopila sp.]